ncbi:MAG: polysaccharide biosynthesis C-terminal domain-containing protein [Lachnospiraceae bacterium]|nr:polysaccharide biosynthesis C-terminal domain-containing protein [Lachnospiraceae bacterium]
MRTKKALINTISGLLYELVAVICGLILPRLILAHFGSRYNGITSSIAQFLSCIALMKAGIGGVSRAALYQPLADGDRQKISSIVKTTQQFMNKIAYLFVGFIVIFSVVYSFFMSKDFSPIFTATLVVIISISTFGEYFFGITYEILLGADQMLCVFSWIRIFTTILNTIVAAILISMDCGIHAVKLGSALVFLINPLFIRWYARRKYKIIDNVEADNKLLSQRWDAVGHEVANFVNTNTDIMVLTIFANVLEVSVYTVYHTVIVGVRKVITSFINGFGAAFGNMYAKKEMELMEKNFRVYELIVFSLVSIIYSITTVMFVPYAVLYTKGVTDVEYARPLFAIVISLAGAFSCIRIPYQNLVTVAGHFKQTRNGAFMEAILNIVISVLMVIKFGLVGVAVGTLVANIFRTIQYAVYMSRNVLKRSLWLFAKHIIIMLSIIAVTNVVGRTVINLNCDSVGKWVIGALIAGCISLSLTVITDLAFYYADVKRFFGKLLNSVKRK